MGIRVFYYLFLLLIKTRITDSTSGFRLYNKKCIAVFARHYPSDYPEPDAIVLLKKTRTQDFRGWRGNAGQSPW